jgi:hypothetical protein
LKLVFANVGSNPGVGAAATNAGQKLEILALPQKLADSVAAHGTVGLASTVVDAGRQGAANILEAANQASLLADTPTDNVLTRGLLGLWDISLWINNSGQTAPLPPGFTAATYTSVLKVISNFVQVGVLPFTVANMAVQGQWAAIPAAINTAVTTAFNSLTQGLPTSFAQTLNWALTGTPPPAPVTATTAVNSLLKASAVGGEASGQDELGKVDDGTTTGGTTTGGTTGGGTTTGGTTTGGTTTGGGTTHEGTTHKGTTHKGTTHESAK